MKIRIVKAGQPTYWYANKIGEVYETSGQPHGVGDYRVLDCRDGTDSPGYVAQEDCEIVEEAEGMEKITVLTDELGLDREYREVKRKAKVGDLLAFDGHANGITAKKAYVVIGGDQDGAEFYDDDGDKRWEAHVPARSCVLEPTDVVRIDGECFRMVERKANVGERVVVVDVVDDAHEFPPGSIGVVERISDLGYEVRVSNLYYKQTLIQEEYRVLVPVQALAHEPLGSAPVAPPSIVSEQAGVAKLVRKSHEQQAQIDGLTETVANLARRVAELERGQAAKDAPEPVLQKALTRDQIIEKAKADVAELKRIGGDRYATLPPTSSLCGKYYDVKFRINRKKNTVVALVYGGISRTLLSRGIAKCVPSDCFNVHIGMAIALRRALGLDIPQEYVNAPQPEEVNVGDYVEVIVGCIKGKRMTLTDRVPKHDSRGFGTAFRHTNDCGWLGSKQIKVIDDSRDGRYGEVYSV